MPTDQNKPGSDSATDELSSSNTGESSNSSRIGALISRFFVRSSGEEKLSTGYVIGLILIIALAATLLAYRLGAQDFRGDEFQVISSATGYLNTGEYYLWDFAKQDVGCYEKIRQCWYVRAWPHTFLIAQSYGIFGISEWSSRLVSVLFGVLLVTISFFFTKYFTEDLRVASMAAFLIGISPYFLKIGRFTRMYALLAPLFLILSYLFYRGITEKSDLSFIPWRNVRGFIARNLHFKFSFLLPAIALLWLIYKIHINALVILPALLIFVLLMTILKQEQRYVIAFAVGMLGLGATFIAGVSISNLPPMIHKLSFFHIAHLKYVEFLTRYPFPQELGAVILLLGIISLVFARRWMIRTKLLYLYSIFLFSLGFFVFIADRYASSNYIAHVFPISVILITFFVMYPALRLRSRFLRWLIIGLLPVFPIAMLATSWNSLYGNDPRFGDFSVAYRTIVKQYDPAKDVIISPRLRTYYLQGMTFAPTVVLLSTKNRMGLNDFVTQLEQYDSGWITWETKEKTDLRKDVKKYIRTHFLKVHGKDVDDTGVEVYYFKQAMMSETHNVPDL